MECDESLPMCLWGKLSICSRETSSRARACMGEQRESLLAVHGWPSLVRSTFNLGLSRSRTRFHLGELQNATPSVFLYDTVESFLQL